MLPKTRSLFSSLFISSWGEDLLVSFGLSCDGGKAHLQLSVLLSQFTSIWVLLRRWESRIGIILSSGDAIMPPSMMHNHQRENDKYIRWGPWHCTLTLCWKTEQQQAIIVLFDCKLHSDGNTCCVQKPAFAAQACMHLLEVKNPNSVRLRFPKWLTPSAWC